MTLGPFTLTQDEMRRWQWSAGLFGLMLAGLLGWRIGAPYLRQWQQKSEGVVVTMTTQEQSSGSEAGDITSLAWLIWWVEGCLLQADSSWWNQGIMLPDSPRRSDWLHVNAVQLNRYFSLPLVLPPDQHASLMQLGMLDTAQRETVLRLMMWVCQPRRNPEHTDAEAIWCERLAKALRPGLWLPPQVTFWLHRRRPAIRMR